MLQKKCRRRLQAAQVLSLCRINGSSRAKEHKASHSQSHSVILSELTNVANVELPGCGSNSGRSRLSKRHSNGIDRQPDCHQEPAVPEFGVFFCGTPSIEASLGPNPFVFDVNIRVQDASSGHLRKIMKRILLDTGSDLNLISGPAHSDLKTHLRPQKCHVRSVAGQSSIVGETRLDWTFIRANPRNETTSNIFSDTFFVLSKKETPLFDCILGRHWIHNHRSVFLALWTG